MTVSATNAHKTDSLFQLPVAKLANRQKVWARNTITIVTTNAFILGPLRSREDAQHFPVALRSVYELPPLYVVEEPILKSQAHRPD